MAEAGAYGEGHELINKAVLSSYAGFRCTSGEHSLVRNLNVLKENSIIENGGHVLGLVSFRQGILGPKLQTAIGWHRYPMIAFGSQQKFRVYPGFPTLFWGLSVFFVGDLMGKALWKLVENAARFPRRGGRVLCVHGAVSFHRARPCGPRWLPGRGAMRDVELDRRVLGLQSTGEYLCSRQNRRPVQAERSIDPGKTGGCPGRC